MLDHKRAISAPRRARARVMVNVAEAPVLEAPIPAAALPVNRTLPLSPALRARQAKSLRERLEPHLDGQLELTITDNRAVMITVRRDPPRRRFAVRVHHLFIDAPDEIIEALARYVAFDDQGASGELGHFIDANDERILPRATEDPTRGRAGRLRTQGKVHDLRSLFNELNQVYFAGEVGAEITWGRHAARGRSRNSVRLGSYTLEERLIRIHPGLDQEWVPQLYLRWVVYHEMLHAVYPIPLVNGRRRFHTEAFAQAERRFEGIALAQAWERRNIAALLAI